MGVTLQVPWKALAQVNQQEEAPMDQEFHDKMSFRSWQQTMCWLQPMPHLSYAHGHNLTTSWLSIDDLVKETIPYSCRSSPSLSGQLCANCKIFSLPSTFVKNQRLVCLHAKKDSSSMGHADLNSNLEPAP